MNQSSSANEKKISSPDSSEVFDASPSKTYHEQAYIDQTLRLREILKTLPAFTKDYFRYKLHLLKNILYANKL